MDSPAQETILTLPIAEIRANPAQPRRLFGEERLRELAESIRLHGIFSR